MNTFSKDIDWYSIVRAVMNEALVKEGHKISGLDLEQGVWHHININDPNSVKMMQMSREGERQVILVHYPQNSSPYKDPNIDKYKIGQVVSGELYDQITGKIYKKGDFVEVGPFDKFKPKTEKNKECYIVVEVRDRKPMKESFKNFISRNC